MKLNSREKLLIILLLVFGFLLVGKSLIEGYRLTEDVSVGERAFYEWVLDKQESEYNEGLYKNGVFTIKLISIKERRQEGQEYYVAKLRKYVLGIVPFSDVFIKEEQGKFINVDQTTEVK